MISLGQKSMTIYKDLKVSDKQANSKLAQLDKHLTGMAEVPGSISTGGNVLVLILFSYSKANDANIVNFV